MITTAQARALAAELLAQCEGRGELAFVPALFATVGRDLAEWILGAAGDDGDGDGAPGSSSAIIMAEIVDAARIGNQRDSIDDFAGQLVMCLPPAVTLRIAAALLRALDDVPP